MQKTDNVWSLLTTVVRWGGMVAIVYFAYRSLETLAGRTTLADVGVAVGVKVDSGDGIALADVLQSALVILAITYGLVQRNLRRRTVERLHDRIEELETKIDPNRSSSNLTKRGLTHPGDAL